MTTSGRINGWRKITGMDHIFLIINLLDFFPVTGLSKLKYQTTIKSCNHDSADKKNRP